MSSAGKIKNPYNKYGDTYTGKELTMYLIGLAGQNIIYNITQTGLMYYLQSVIFLPAMAISIIIAVARVWDAINDPMMGTIVDRTHSKWGKCRPYLIFAPPVICVITILTFANRIYTMTPTQTGRFFIIVWAAVSYILWGMAYTVGDIPLWGITALMTSRESDRAKVLSWARISAAVGAGVVVAGIVPLSQMLGKKITAVIGDGNRGLQLGCIIVAVVLTIIASILFELAGIFTRERIPQTEERHTMKENFRMIWQNKPFRQILMSSVLKAPIQLIGLIGVSLATYYFGDNGNAPMTSYFIYLAVIGGGFVSGTLLFTVLTPKFIKNQEKSKIYNIVTVFSAIPFIVIYVIYKLAPYNLTAPFCTFVLGLSFFVCGGAQGIANVLQSIMISDAIDYEEYKNNIRPDGVFFSGQSFATKLSAGISMLIEGAVFKLVGFSDANVQMVNEALARGASFKTQFPQYAEAMFFLCSVPPAIGMLISVIPTLKYALSDKEHIEILKKLKIRHEKMLVEKSEIKKQ